MFFLKSFKRLMLVGLAAALFFFTTVCVAAEQTAQEISNALKAYVTRSDDSFGFEVVRTVNLPKADAFLLKLTSQTWRDIAWQHELFLVVPHERKYPDNALLIISDGNNRKRPPEINPQTAMMSALLSEQIGSAVAMLMQVPNQPLKNGLREDDLIAYTFDRYLKTGDVGYPLLLPMVKSATAAMDAITKWSADRYERPIERFFVTGASKRGWTTWLTAAVDDRVVGIAPMVIDLLNVEPQMQRQLKTYGRYSPMIQDYVNHGVLGRMGTERGDALMAMIDPYAYRDRITVPKLIVLGTNDPYWTVDAANLYVPDLVGPTWLHYSPNAGHNLGAISGGGLSATIMTMASFIRMQFAGEPIPELHWRHEPLDTLIVRWDDEDAEAVLWSAQSENRDFRQAKWQSQNVDGRGRAEMMLTAPDKGWGAWFVEVRFGKDKALRLSTAITVLPETFPHELPEE